jgi:DNA polymerase phi
LFQPGVPSQDWDRIVAALVELGKAKPWLQEECGWILWRALYELASQNADVKYSESVIEIISSKDIVKSPEGVAIWLLVQDSFPTAKLPQELWKYNNDPLDRRDMSTLVKIMKQASEAEEGSQSASTSVWNSKLHFAWDAILKRLHDTKPGDDKQEKRDKKKKKESRITFEEFWKEVVDSTYLFLVSRICIQLIFFGYRWAFCLFFFRRAQILGIFPVYENLRRSSYTTCRDDLH